MSSNRFDYEIADDATLAEFAQFQEAKRAKATAAAAAAAPIDYENTPDPRKVAAEEGRRVLDDGGTEAEALAMHAGHLIAAAARGDRRVLVNNRPPWERAQQG